MKTTNLNINKEKDKNFVYCGRGSLENNNPLNCEVGKSGWLGNPIVKGQPCIICGLSHTNNGETLPCYRTYLNLRLENLEFKEKFFQLKGKTLGCFCKPNHCHTDIMIYVLDNPVCFTGVGSRETPIEVLSIMKDISKKLTRQGFILRTGDAEGADKAFREGVFNNNCEIYTAIDSTNVVEDIAKKYHPAWNNCSMFARKLLGRNVFQVKGKDLQTNSKFLICWTKNGQSIGGTRIAIELAKDEKIPVFNLALKNDVENLILFLNENYNISL
jgi:hypothetical protein